MVTCGCLDGTAALAVVGDRAASELVLCQPGFPDKYTAMLPLARRLASEGKLVGVISMPE